MSGSVASGTPCSNNSTTSTIATTSRGTYKLLLTRLVIPQHFVSSEIEALLQDEPYKMVITKPCVPEMAVLAFTT